MRRRNAYILIGLSLVFITSCSKNTGGDGTTNGGNNGGGGTTTPGPLFTSVRTIVRGNCALSGCHTTPNPQNGVNFSDDNVIVQQKFNIKSRAVDKAGTTEQMPPPPAAPLSTADRQKIVDWVNAGGRITD